ncbi:hypothetical protein J6590_062950 [Homalodisca vitripennis]|nr:hypothetical protein J6590_062950 [Homalodisca vitripennis]
MLNAMLRLEYRLGKTSHVQGEGGAKPGKIYLPSSFNGGLRYMKIHYENAMALVTRLGSPTYFLTFTYNVMTGQKSQETQSLQAADNDCVADVSVGVCELTWESFY